MGKIIVTKTNLRKEPFCMRETGHLLYSYEELCYYIYSRMSLWLMEKERDGLTQWIIQCGVTIEDVDFMPPYDAAAKILAAGNYFRVDEKRQILEKMRRYDEFPIAYVEKDKGDLYLSYGKSKNAYLSYEKAIYSITGEENTDWKTSLYHNMGMACCRFFYWDEAKKWFTKAMDVSEKEETKIALTLVEDMLKNEWEWAGGACNLEKIEKKKQEFINEL